MSPRLGFTQTDDKYSGIAVIYARFSSHNQREVSIEQQVKECRKFAEANNLRVIEVYSDKAVTGRTDRRTNFQRMMRDANTGKFQYVVAWKSNRMGRNMLEAMINDAKLREMGIRTLYTEEDFDDTAAGRFALRNMMNVNQFYSENMAEDIKRGLEDNAEKCMVNGSLPYGYKKGPDGKYAIDEPRAAVIREIFDKYLQGVPNVEICDSLNARGITTKTGGPWTRTSFWRILSNERYIGVYEHSGIRIEGGVPAIVSKEVFYAVQERSKTKPNAVGASRRGRADYLLTGKLLCGDCGTPMIGISGTGRNGDLHYYYTCSGKRGGNGCNKSNIRREVLEQLVIDMLLDAISEDAAIEFLTNGYAELRKRTLEESDLVLLQQELADNQKALANIMKAIEAGIFNNTTADRMSELEQNIKRLERDIEMQSKFFEEMPTADEYRFYLEDIRNKEVTNNNFRRSLISSFVSCVRLWDDWIEVEYGFKGGGPDNKKERRRFTKDSEETTSDKKNEEGGLVRIVNTQLHQHTVKGHPSPDVP